MGAWMLSLFGEVSEENEEDGREREWRKRERGEVGDSEKLKKRGYI